MFSLLVNNITFPLKFSSILKRNLIFIIFPYSAKY
nr:MAG TPA: hypothetical protein [Caudoviricetes sp.]